MEFITINGKCCIYAWLYKQVLIYTENWDKAGRVFQNSYSNYRVDIKIVKSRHAEIKAVNNGGEGGS